MLVLPQVPRMAHMPLPVLGLDDAAGMVMSE